MIEHVCAVCGGKTDPLLEHRSEVDLSKVFHAACCGRGCDAEDEPHVGDV